MWAKTGTVLEILFLTAVLAFFGYTAYGFYLDRQTIDVLIYGFEPNEKVVLGSYNYPQKMVVYADHGGLAYFRRVPPGLWSVLEGGSPELRREFRVNRALAIGSLQEPKFFAPDLNYQIQMKTIW